MAWAMVPSSSQSSSPPTGTPRARLVTCTCRGVRRSDTGIGSCRVIVVNIANTFKDGSYDAAPR